MFHNNTGGNHESAESRGKFGRSEQIAIVLSVLAMLALFMWLFNLTGF